MQNTTFGFIEILKRFRIVKLSLHGNVLNAFQDSGQISGSGLQSPGFGDGIHRSLDCQSGPFLKKNVLYTQSGDSEGNFEIKLTSTH